MKTVLDRADCADFGCHNSIRLETKHFLNTLALTFISFSGRFVFAMQKHYLFFASDPLVIFGLFQIQNSVFLEIWVGFHERSSPSLKLKLATCVSNYWNILLEPMGSALMDFTKGLSLSFG